MKNNKSAKILAIFSVILGTLPGIITILIFNEYPLRLFPLALQRYIFSRFHLFFYFLTFFLPFCTIILGIIAIILGVISIGKIIKEKQLHGKKLITALSIIGIVCGFFQAMTFLMLFLV